MRTRCVVGLSVHTGWAACVVVSGSLLAPRVERRERMTLLGDADRFVFHAAAAAPRTDAPGLVDSARARAAAQARLELTRLAGQLRASGQEVVGCAILANTTVARTSLEEILAAHTRIHTAEGHFYRDVLLAATRAARLTAQVFPPRTLEAAAAYALHVAEVRIPGLLAGAGQGLGPPWGKDQRLAALAAWTLLARAAGPE
jgi:hypothetical protein